MGQVNGSRKDKKLGKVFLVGAGPGDPGLITAKGIECLRRADIVLYDALVDPSILKYARRRAQFLFIGKRKGKVSAIQSEISRTLVKEARLGKAVVRLKGGDPLLFGRGVDEVISLKKARISFEIVPGVSSAWAVPAYAGISLTDRALSSSVTIVTGHEDPRKKSRHVSWKRLARGSDTLVIFMGGTRLEAITKKLVQFGRKANTPCALLYWGTTRRQRSLFSTLGSVANAAREKRFKTPSLLVVGAVAGARRLGAWWREEGLQGKKVLVTRPRAQSQELAQALQKKGACVLAGATIRIKPPFVIRPLDGAIRRIETFDWLIFTSINGVDGFLRRWKKIFPGMGLPKKVRVAAIGTRTRAALKEAKIHVSLMPERYQAEGLLAAFKKAQISIRDQRILLPTAARTRPVLVQGLRQMGARVTKVETYRTVPDVGTRRLLNRLSRNGGMDLVTFTSGSTVENLVELMGEKKAHVLMNQTLSASIGPVTSATLSRFNLPVDIEARHATIPSLVQEIDHYFR
jgi:uroporphyrinogen III methyltransferase / synthase